MGRARVPPGAATTLALGTLLYLLVSVTIDPLLYAVMVSGGRLVTPAIRDLLVLVDALSFLFHLAAVLAFICVSAVSVVAVALWLVEPVSGPAGAYTRSENAGTMIPWLLVGFIVLPPLVPLAGYIGGRFGQPLLRRMADR